uniref:Uncharacterized protein n=1 Tax=Thermorudis peleae TaxID=1382356 RepID=A0A831TFA4_9BACT
MPWTTLNWVLWLIWMVNVALLSSIEAVTGRRPGRHEPSRWHSRLLSAALGLLAIVFIVYPLLRGPFEWMRDPVSTAFLVLFTTASFWPWFTLVRCRLRRGRNGGHTIETA